MTRFDPASEAPELGGLWERIHRAVVELRGAGSTVWNGRVDLLSRDEAPRTTGGAETHGRIRLSRNTVDVLARLYQAGPGLLRDQFAAAECRRALTAAAHEFGHLTGPPGYTVEDWNREVAEHPRLSIEESFEEAQTRMRLDELIGRVLPPAYGPGLRAARDTDPDLGPGAYPAGVEAVDGFASKVRSDTGIDQAEVVATAARAPASGKAAALAELLVRRGLDATVVPERRLERVRAKVATAIEEGFAGIDPDRAADPERLGHQVATQALGIVDRARRQSTGQGPVVSWLREAGHVLDGLTHPGSRRPPAGRGAGADRGAAGRPPAAGRQPQLPGQDR